MPTKNNRATERHSSSIPFTPPFPSNIHVKLPGDYLLDGYKNENRRYDVKYVTSTAEDIAGLLFKARMSGKTFAAFFNRMQYFPRTSDIDRLKLEAGKLIPLAVNLVNKNQAPQIFVDFLRANLAAIRVSQDFYFFRDHFEAVACYLCGLEKQFSPHR